ncbi:MAG: hypothetical protein K2W94_08740 [Alphaproteobacteria bacterium]|nr:hypothetical protein [Alphaproteobacteria bacterium]
MLEKAGYTVRRFTIDLQKADILTFLKTELAEFLPSLTEPKPDKEHYFSNGYYKVKS